MQISNTGRLSATGHEAGDGEAVPRRYLNGARLLLLLLAILSVVVLARDGFRIPLNVYLDRLLDVYDEMFRTVAVLIFEPAIKAMLAVLAQWFQIELILLPHWKYVFFLWWLVFAAIARVIQSDARVHAIRWYAWGGLCALLGGAVAGLTPLSSAGSWISSSALFFYLCGTNLYAALLEGLTVSRASWAVGSAFAMTIGVSSFAGIFFDPRADNFGLKVLLTTIALFASGIVLIAIGPARYRAAGSGSFWREFLAVREVTVALDVLTVLGCAALVVAAGQLWA